MKSPLGTFLNAPALRKHCVWFFKLYTTKIPWSNHQVMNVLVVPSRGKTLRSLSPEAFGALVLTSPGRTAPSLPFRARYSGLHRQIGYFWQSFTIATTCPAEEHQTRRSPPGPRQVGRQRRTNAPSLWLPPARAILQRRTSLSSDLPKPRGLLKG